MSAFGPSNVKRVFAHVSGWQTCIIDLQNFPERSTLYSIFIKTALL